MNRHEKIAWFNLAVITVSVLLCFGMFFHTRVTHPLDVSIKTSFAAFAVFAFLGLGPVIFKKKAESDDTDTVFGDERDILIQRRAQSFGFQAFWLILVFGVMLAWIYLRFISPEGRMGGTMTISVDVDMVPFMLFPAAIILVTASSLSAIFQYRLEDIGDNSMETGAGASRKTIVYLFSFFLFFLAFSIFMVSFSNWMYAVKFLMLVFAAGYSMVRSLRYNPGGDYTAGDIRLLKIVGRVLCGLFISFFTASTVSVILDVIESQAMSTVISRLSILGFGALIFTLSLLKYRDKHPLEGNHEQA